MQAEILATGDEIRSGALVDTNSAAIAEKLEETGVAVQRHVCAGDDPDVLEAIIKEISDRADICVVTGGLGPTTDDITAEAAAAAAGVDLKEDQKALCMIAAFFKARNREMTASNRKQALVPRQRHREHCPVPYLAFQVRQDLPEGMAASLAVITTRGTGCEEVVGDSGLLVDPFDWEAIQKALVRLYDDPELAAGLGAASRKRLVNNYGWRVVTDQYLQVYQEVIR